MCNSDNGRFYWFFFKDLVKAMLKYWAWSMMIYVLLQGEDGKFSIYVHSRPGFVLSEATTRSKFFLDRQVNDSIQVADTRMYQFTKSWIFHLQHYFFLKSSDSIANYRLIGVNRPWLKQNVYCSDMHLEIHLITALFFFLIGEIDSVYTFSCLDCSCSLS